MKTDSSAKILEAIEILEKEIQNPTEGLPQEIFYFASRLMPLVNIDLLVRDKNGRSLLAWRDDIHTGGGGWHIPGGILRYKERLEDRIEKVALTEIGHSVEFNPNPIAINQLWKKKPTRGHFISILYHCSLDEKSTPKNEGLIETDPGFLKWHNECPDELLMVHDKIYRDIISEKDVKPSNKSIGFNYFPQI